MPLDPTTLTPEKLEELARTAARITAPTFHASSIQIQWAGNDGLLIFARPQPATLPPMGEIAPFALQEITAIVHMSGATLKDLAVLLADQVRQYEEKNGTVIETDYTRRLKNS